MCTITNFLELIREARSQDKLLTQNLRVDDRVLKRQNMNASLAVVDTGHHKSQYEELS